MEQLQSNINIIGCALIGDTKPRELLYFGRGIPREY